MKYDVRQGISLLMHRWVLLQGATLVVILVVACGEPRRDLGASGGHPAGVEPMLGRWDATATAEGDAYPLWFELTDQNGRIGGRFQGRFGHAVSIDTVEAVGDRITLRVGKDTYTGTLGEGRWQGEGTREDGSSIRWAAFRAPELAPPTAVEWDEPVPLVSGRDLSGWRARHPEQPLLWRAESGELVNTGSGTDLVTESAWADFKLHVEVKVPAGGNSGIYLRGRCEIQVQDDFGKELGSRHMGGIYGQVTPTVNAARPAGEWQEFDVTLLGRWVTVVLNGTTIIESQEIPGITGGALDSDEEEPGPLMLQGDHGPISYRNIVLTPARTVPAKDEGASSARRP